MLHYSRNGRSCGKKIGQQNAKRNLLAHYSVTQHVPQHGQATLRLARNILDTRDKEHQEIDLRKLAEYEPLFRQLASVIDGFTTKISPIIAKAVARP
jgi:hypothetical protein